MERLQALLQNQPGWQRRIFLRDQHDSNSTALIKQKKRQTWSSKWDFYFSCLGYAIGLGNVWRFPYLAYTFGGGSFVIAYGIVLVLVGIPLVLLELALGQYSGVGPAVLFRKMCPLFGGLGYAIMINQFLICTYYSMIIAWAFYYLFASFTTDVPWSHCGPYSTPFCFSERDFQTCWRRGGFYQAGCFDPTLATQAGMLPVPAHLRITSAEDYLNQYVLNLSGSISNFGSPNWKLTLCLLLGWTVCMLCLIRGIKSSGKVVWFTTLFPLVCLVIFVIRGATLANAMEGVKFYITPDWKKLGSLTLWVQAAAQVFFNLSVGGGGLITYSSYNNFKHKFYFDAVTLPILNGLTSLLAGFAVFSALGFMAGQLGVPVSKVVREGPGLVFIAYPDAITRMPVPVLMFMFFLSTTYTPNLLLYLDSLGNSLKYYVVTGITDTWPKILRRKRLVIFGVCCAGFLVGILFTTRAGLYWVQLFDFFVVRFLTKFMVAGWPIVLFGFCEILVVLVYGVRRISAHITTMVRRPVSWFYKILWYTLVPVCTLGLVISDWATHQPAAYNGVPFPPWSQGVGWLLATFPVLVIPLFAIYKLLKTDKTLSSVERFLVTLRPVDFYYRQLLENTQEETFQPAVATRIPSNISQKMASTLPISAPPLLMRETKV